MALLTANYSGHTGTPGLINLSVLEADGAGLIGTVDVSSSVSFTSVGSQVFGNVTPSTSGTFILAASANANLSGFTAPGYSFSNLTAVGGGEFWVSNTASTATTLISATVHSLSSSTGIACIINLGGTLSGAGHTGTNGTSGTSVSTSVTAAANGSVIAVMSYQISGSPSDATLRTLTDDQNNTYTEVFHFSNTLGGVVYAVSVFTLFKFSVAGGFARRWVSI